MSLRLPAAILGIATVLGLAGLASAWQDPGTTKSKAAHDRTHVVRRGETWFAIARTTYGDGGQWHRLAAANPGVAAAGPLKVGQKLIVP